MLPFSVGITVFGIILAIINKNIKVFWMMLIVAGIALVFDLTQFALRFIVNYWVSQIIIPFILTMVVFFFAKNFINKLKI
ncbi:hypothetical protein MHH37_16795 [Solibacillus sp. FSL K6-1781]|uniref:hypothetical protein n=1 Tax=Solibacillus sp. FSL K6-1781 TaxID=2921474 RepID=UPI00315A9CEC